MFIFDKNHGSNHTRMNYQTIIKELREQKGISQEKLSEESGVSLRTIQRIESGECTPRESSLKTIAKSLNVTFEYLVNNPLEESELNPNNEHIQPKKGRAFSVYRIASTLIGASLGFMIGLIIIEMQLFKKIEEGFIPFILLVMLGAIGLLVGNMIECKNTNTSK